MEMGRHAGSQEDEPSQDEGRRRSEARDVLRGELRQVVGDDAARRAERSGGLDAALDAGTPRTVTGVLSESRVLIAIMLFVALIVGAVIAAITGSWWFVLVALVLHALGTAIVVGTSLSLAAQTESPDPRTAAALEARGVRNPDAALNQAVDAAAEADRAENDNGMAAEVNRVAGWR